MRAWIAFILTIALGVTTAVAGTNITFNGTSYTVPAVADASWGNAVSSYLIAIAAGALQKTGGTFTLTQEVDFGSTYGLKAPYFKSKTATIASTGVLRMGTSDAVSWRNAANNADLPLTVNASNVLQFNGNPIITLGLGSANTALLMNSGGTGYAWTTIANANIDVAAAIAYSKLNLASSIATGDLASGLLVPVAKGGTGLTAGTSGGILGYTATGTLASSALLAANGVMLGGGAGATPTATAAGAANNVFVVPNAGGAPVFGQVNVGSTSAVTGTLPIGNGGTGQTTALAAFNALSPLTTEGDFHYYHSSANARLGIGTSDQVLVSNGLDPLWGKVNIGSTVAVTGTLPIASGGSGQTTANAALNAFLPTQTSNSGKVLSTDGSNTSWAAALTSTLSSAHLFVGNVSNVATDVAITGDVTFSNAGVTSLAASLTGNKTLTGTLKIQPADSAGVQSGLELFDAGGGSGEGLWVQWSSTDYAKNSRILGQGDGVGGSLLFQTNVTTTGNPATEGSIDHNGVWAMNHYANGSMSFTGANGTISSSSDSRLKTTFPGSVPGLKEVNKLQPHFYKWKSEVKEKGDAAELQLGFYAQEVGSVIPTALGQPAAKGGYYGLYDRPIMAALVEAVKELSAQQASLKAEFAAYKAAHEASPTHH